MKKFSLIFIAILCVIALASCGSCGGSCEHSYDNDCDAICNECGEQREVGDHVYDNACDTKCNVCDAEREVGDHVYDNACDPTCNECGTIRIVGDHIYDNTCDARCNACDAERAVGPHGYDNACDTTCNICGAERTVEPHVYDNACDTKCNVCNAERTITHDHADTLTAGETTHWYACSVCGDKKDEAAHVFDKTVASSEYLKAAATATTKAQYYKSCVCGKASTTEYFETDKTAGTLANIQDLSKTYDKVELANPTYETNSDGAVTIEWYQGDTKLDSKPLNAGTYKVKVIIAESATYTGISAEKEFTIAKKVLSNMKASIVYDGSTTFGEMTLAHDGIVSGDVIIADIDVTNKNVGVYTGTDAMFAILDVLGHGAANYEIDAQTTEVTVTPKVLNYLNLTKVYDGTAGYNDSVFFLDTTHGLVAGDVVSIETNDDAEYNVGTYTLTDTSGEWELDDCIYLEGADAANYAFNYQANGAVATITVTKRPVWAENVEFTYDGYTNWTGEESSKQIVFQNMANGETMDSSFVEWTFDSKNVGAKLASVTFVDEDDGRSNYEINFSKCSASIIPKVISGLSAEFVYNNYHAFHSEPLNAANGIVSNDLSLGIFVTVEFNGVNVGSTVNKAYLNVLNSDVAVLDNYTLDLSTCSANIVKREIWVTDVQFIYNGYTMLCDDESVTGRTVHNAASTADEYEMSGYFYFTFENSNVGSNIKNVELDGRVSSNYTINVSKCSGEIVCREIEVPTTASFEYVKNRTQYNLAIENLKEGESLALAIHFRKAEVGSDPYYATWISPNGSTKTVEELLKNYQPAGYIDWDEYKSTVFQTAEITPKMLDFTNETLTKVYDQNAKFSYTVSEVTDEELVASFVAVDGDGVALKDAGEFTGVDASSVVFSINGVQTNNYAFRETEGIANVTVTPKQLNFDTLYFNYPPGYYYATLEIRLGTSVGVYEGDVARLFATFKHMPENNSAITLDTASSVYIYAENNAKINKNYVLPEDKSTITVYTSTFDSITIDQETLKGTYTVDSDFTDCILLVKIPTTGGYIFSSTENFMTDNLYDANGNIMKESTNTPGNYGLEAGTYYWQVSVNSTPLGTLNVEKNIPTGAKEKPHAISYNSDKFIAEDAHVDWSVADEYYYKVGLKAGTYTVSQKGLKISVFDTSWNTVANLTDKFTISTNGSYYVYISKGDNAEVYDTITKFTLVNDLLLDGNADFMSDSSYEQGVLVSESYEVNNGQIISFCFDPEYKVTQVYTFELISNTNSFGNLVASYRFYDSDFREVAITWDGETLTFPSGYTEQDALYIVVQFKAADTGVYLRAE